MKLYNWSFSSLGGHSLKKNIMFGYTPCCSSYVILFTGLFLFSMICQTTTRMLQVPLHYRHINVDWNPLPDETLRPRHRRYTGHDALRLPAPPPTSGSLMGRSGQGYYITIYIGTPPQQLNVLVDTGSSNLAVAAYPDPLVTSYFSRENSSTVKDLGIIVNVPYTQGEWKGILVKDMVRLSILPTNVSVQTQLACITQSQGFFINESNWQGILGLAYAKIARPDSSIVPYFDSLIASYNVEDVFSIQMCGTVPGNSSSTELPMAGTMIIGGVDDSMYDGPLFTSPIFREWYYEIVITDMEVDGKSLHMDCKEYNFDKTIVDSGTTNLRLPVKVYANVVHRIKQYVLLPGLPSRPSNEFWEGTDSLCWHRDEVPYGSFPYLTIALAHTENQVYKLVLSPQQYLRPIPGVSDTETDTCYKFAISKSDSGTVMGAVVMEAFYTVFNRQNRTVGFGKSKCSVWNNYTMVSYIEGLFSYKGNATQCAYMRSIEENSTMLIVAYVMAGVCVLCFIPLFLLIIQCQVRRCRQRKSVKDDSDHRPLQEDIS